MLEDDKSILHYLLSKAVAVEYQNNKYVCRSPFTRDSTPSFTIYKTNTFYCWATGKWGRLNDLVQYYENCSYPKALEIMPILLKDIPKHDVERDFKTDARENEVKKFDYLKYINHDQEEVKNIFNYAKGRSIFSGFLPGVYWSWSSTQGNARALIRHPALMFLHQDLNLNICGAKFRNTVSNTSGPRFAFRGTPGFYILDTSIQAMEKDKGRIYLCESETSANSLWSYLREIGVQAIIYSMGGVSNIPKTIPAISENKTINLIIDYDGDEELYNKRIKNYEHLNINPIKLILPKGEDINSLHNTNKMWMIEHSLLKT